MLVCMCFIEERCIWIGECTTTFGFISSDCRGEYMIQLITNRNKQEHAGFLIWGIPYSC